jgi:hypothetical protein
MRLHILGTCSIHRSHYTTFNLKIVQCDLHFSSITPVLVEDELTDPSRSNKMWGVKTFVRYLHAHSVRLHVKPHFSSEATAHKLIAQKYEQSVLKPAGMESLQSCGPAFHTRCFQKLCSLSSALVRFPSLYNGFSTSRSSFPSHPFYGPKEYRVLNKFQCKIASRDWWNTWKGFDVKITLSMAMVRFWSAGNSSLLQRWIRAMVHKNLLLP